MARLILLNGPPAVGKSTVAARYADHHPGTLNLDIDSLHYLIGGWREFGGRVHEFLRPMALAMAASHLAAGFPVIVPQYIARLEAVAAFEQIAGQHDAELLEVVLMVGRDEAVARFEDRQDDSEWTRHNRRLVDDLGGEEFLGAMHDQLVTYLEHRPNAVRVTSRVDAIDDTFAELLRVL